jgi:hypothetical protein
MDGSILHFTAEGGGLIRGSDGKRYAFASDQWKSDSPAQTGDLVDFEVENDRALEVYRVRPSSAAAAAAATQPAGPGSSPAPLAGGAGLDLARRPGLVFAGLILLSCFLPFIAVPIVTISLFNAASWAGMAFSMSRGGSGSLAQLCVYLLYAVPISAGWLIFKELRYEATDKLRGRTGIIGLVTPFAVLLLVSIIMSSGRRSRSDGDFGLSLIGHAGLGWILLIGASVALIATARGWRPFGASAGDPPATAEKP